MLGDRVARLNELLQFYRGAGLASRIAGGINRPHVREISHLLVVIGVDTHDVSLIRRLPSSGLKRTAQGNEKTKMLGAQTNLVPKSD